MPEDSRLKRAGVTGYNKPKATPKHPTKSHVVVAKVLKVHLKVQRKTMRSKLVMLLTLLKENCLPLTGLTK